MLKAAIRNGVASNSEVRGKESMDYRCRHFALKIPILTFQIEGQFGLDIQTEYDCGR